MGTRILWTLNGTYLCTGLQIDATFGTYPQSIENKLTFFCFQITSGQASMNHSTKEAPSYDVHCAWFWDGAVSRSTHTSRDHSVHNCIQAPITRTAILATLLYCSPVVIRLWSGDFLRRLKYFWHFMKAGRIENQLTGNLVMQTLDCNAKPMKPTCSLPRGASPAAITSFAALESATNSVMRINEVWVMICRI